MYNPLFSLLRFLLQEFSAIQLWISAFVLYQLPTIALRAFECLTDLPEEPPFPGLETTWDSVRLAQPLSFTLFPRHASILMASAGPRSGDTWKRRIAFPGCQRERNREREVVVVWGSLLRHRGGSHGPLEVSGSLWDPVRPPAMEEREGRGACLAC